MDELMEFLIPDEVKDLTLPLPEELTYWQLRKLRTFFIDYEIDDNYRLMDLSKDIIRMNMEEKDVENPKPIYIYIQSYGGDLDQSLFFCDLIKASRIPVVTIATGSAMSAGLLIFLSGHRRYAFPHSQILIHEGSAQFSGTADQVKQAQKSYEKQIADMKQYILDNTKIDAKLYSKNKTKDWYVHGEDIINLGIADKLITSFSDIE